MVRLETSPKMMVSPAAAGRPDRVRVEVEDDVADPGLLEDVGQVPAVEAVAGDDDVVLEIATGLSDGRGRSSLSSGSAFAALEPGPARPG